MLLRDLLASNHRPAKAREPIKVAVRKN